MNKEEMMVAIKGGAKVTHRHFTPDEWMIWVGPWFEFEDGNRCTPAQFWFDRTDESWDRDWSVVEANENNQGA